MALAAASHPEATAHLTSISASWLLLATGGALIWADNLPVTPGSTYNLAVGAGGKGAGQAGGASWFNSTAWLLAQGGAGAVVGGGRGGPWSGNAPGRKGMKGARGGAQSWVDVDANSGYDVAGGGGGAGGWTNTGSEAHEGTGTPHALPCNPACQWLTDCMSPACITALVMQHRHTNTAMCCCIMCICGLCAFAYVCPSAAQRACTSSRSMHPCSPFCNDALTLAACA